MTHWTDANDLIEERGLPTPGFAARYVPGALAFALSAALGVYLVYLRAPVSVPSAPPELAEAPQDAFGGLAPVVPAPSPATPPRSQENPYGALVTKGFGTSARFAIAESSIPTPPVPPSNLRLSQDDAGVPLPPRRPSALARQSDEPAPAVVARLESPRPSVSAAPAAPSGPGILEKLFGGVSTASKAPETRLAYAAPPPVSGAGVSSALASRGGLGSPSGFGGFLNNLNIGSSNPTSRFGDRVAVYDISAHVVYMPDGTRIEAHSGLGDARDDPNKVNERMRGPTPPATYALTPREGSFHGVDALRLTPIDGNVFGRAGLLAHTYMLGAEGDSNGCISFRDYDAFLRAYRNGQISKVVVVTRL